MHLRQTAVLTSAHRSVLAQLKPLAGPTQLGLIIREPADPESVKKYADRVLIRHNLVTAEYVAAAHAHNLLVEVWTVDDADGLARSAASVWTASSPTRLPRSPRGAPPSTTGRPTVSSSGRQRMSADALDASELTAEVAEVKAVRWADREDMVLMQHLRNLALPPCTPGQIRRCRRPQTSARSIDRLPAHSGRRTVVLFELAHFLGITRLRDRSAGDPGPSHPVHGVPGPRRSVGAHLIPRTRRHRLVHRQMRPLPGLT